jgi:hypothetical protein
MKAVTKDNLGNWIEVRITDSFYDEFGDIVLYVRDNEDKLYIRMHDEVYYISDKISVNDLN